MNKFFEYLMSIGYTAEGCTSLQFSSVKPNGCLVSCTKDNSRFTFGLNEKGNPPTLIFPRKYKLERTENRVSIREFTDAEMSGYLLNNDSEYIYNDLLKDSIK